MSTLTFIIVYHIFIPLSPITATIHHTIVNTTKDWGKPLFGLTEAYQKINFDKAYYYRSSNILRYRKPGFPFGSFHLLSGPEHCDTLRSGNVVALVDDGGINGFCRGPKQHLIDRHSITDPLIARLPTPDLSRGFIPGGFTKKVPDGLLESCIYNKNMIKDPELHDYFEKLFVITRGKIFSAKRFKYIFELNLPSKKKYHKDYY